MPRHDDFYVRYYVGHRGKFGHEFMEFEFRGDGKLRYANNSNYKKDSMIRKEVTVSQSVIDEVKRIISDSEITKNWKWCWVTTTFLSRARRSDLYWTFKTARILRVYVYCTTWSKTSSAWCFR
uniref:Uncharacterized protein n=1 Tax=Hyaloperonospora arabidopsidis (strain Emoy2) TaxID=559515 RepID=M4B2C4_HYAAE